MAVGGIPEGCLELLWTPCLGGGQLAQSAYFLLSLGREAATTKCNLRVGTTCILFRPCTLLPHSAPVSALCNMHWRCLSAINYCTSVPQHPWCTPGASVAHNTLMLVTHDVISTCGGCRRMDIYYTWLVAAYLTIPLPISVRLKH